LPEFRPIFDALSHMGFYNINPALLRGLQSPDKGDVLLRDGRNLASVTARMEKVAAPIKERVEEYLSLVVPGLVGFGHKSVGHMETVEFRQKVEGAADPWRFPAINMSDGTLRAVAVLVALFQSGNVGAVHLVGLEEPETALHPAAAGVLRDCIFEARRSVQVIVTSTARICSMTATFRYSPFEQLKLLMAAPSFQESTTPLAAPCATNCIPPANSCAWIN
jgi:predicted ATPase